jgi:hypothetical protein
VGGHRHRHAFVIDSHHLNGRARHELIAVSATANARGGLSF